VQWARLLLAGAPDQEKQLVVVGELVVFDDVHRLATVDGDDFVADQKACRAAGDASMTTVTLGADMSTGYPGGLGPRSGSRKPAPRR